MPLVIYLDFLLRIKMLLCMYYVPGMGMGQKRCLPDSFRNAHDKTNNNVIACFGRETAIHLYTKHSNRWWVNYHAHSFFFVLAIIDSLFEFFDFFRVMNRRICNLANRKHIKCVPHLRWYRHAILVVPCRSEFDIESRTKHCEKGHWS